MSREASGLFLPKAFGIGNSHPVCTGLLIFNTKNALRLRSAHRLDLEHSEPDTRLYRQKLNNYQ